MTEPKQKTEAQLAAEKKKADDLKAKQDAEAAKKAEAEAAAKQAEADRLQAIEDAKPKPGVIKSSHDVPLTLHTGVTVPAGGEVAVDDVKAIENHPVCGAWIKADILKVDTEGESE